MAFKKKLAWWGICVFLLLDILSFDQHMLFFQIFFYWFSLAWYSTLRWDSCLWLLFISGPFQPQFTNVEIFRWWNIQLVAIWYFHLVACLFLFIWTSLLVNQTRLACQYFGIRPNICLSCGPNEYACRGLWRTVEQHVPACIE